MSAQASSVSEAKSALDKVIGKAKSHAYKPIQVAEILHQSRTQSDTDIDPWEKETYRVASRHWRDDIARRLVGRGCTSTARYQDNLFDENAIPPHVLATLDSVNRDTDGRVESYIYHKLNAEKWHALRAVYDHVESDTPDEFELDALLELFDHDDYQQTRDKLYEAVVFTVFDAVITGLDANMHLTVDANDGDFIEDFADFTELVFGLDPGETAKTFPAEVRRVGVTNANDSGIDIRTNFGPVVQVKYIDLSEDLAEGVGESEGSRRIIIVCQGADKDVIQKVATHLDVSDRIQSVITLDNLRDWCELCLHEYSDTVGDRFLETLEHEIEREFPQVTELDELLDERDYTTDQLDGRWTPS